MTPRTSTPITQTQHPWRATARTMFQGFLALCVILPLAVAAAGIDMKTAAPWLIAAIGVAGAVTRVMAVPAVNAWIATYVPFLAATSKPEPAAVVAEPEAPAARPAARKATTKRAANPVKKTPGKG